MAKGKGKGRKTKRNTNAKQSKRVDSKTAAPVFGPISTITTAPTAIGNSMSGFQTQVMHTADGVRVFGRDFAFAGNATGTVTTWAWTGGMPLTPSCLPSTTLRSMVQMYNKFKINACQFHYITSSSTSTTGDILFYYQKNTSSSMVEWTNNSFLPYVLSDSLTVIGPQWTNHTAQCLPKGGFKSTDYGMTAEPSDYSFGEIHLFSKTSSTESPGYVVFDFDITFKELSVNPRAGLLPIAKAQYNAVTFAFSGLTAPTQDVTPVSCQSLSANWIGGVSTQVPTVVAGDVYKIILDVSNSTLTGKTAGSIFRAAMGAFTPTLTTAASIQTVTIRDGYTIYGVALSSQAFQFYPTLGAAAALSDPFYASTGTYASVLLCGAMYYVTSVLPSTQQSSF